MAPKPFRRIEGAGMHTEVNLFEKPIGRIEEACDLMGSPLTSSGSYPNSKPTLRAWLPMARPTRID
jgi:hypothetical protein